MKFYSDVKINIDRQYSKSYGAPEIKDYAFACVSGNWIELFDNTGYSFGKKSIVAKHFHDYTGKEITERTFKMRTKKAMAAELKALELKKQEKQKKADEHEAFIVALRAELPIRIAKVEDRIKEVITAEEIKTRLDYDMQTNEICNRAVGIVDYKYAKHLGWMLVLRTIYSQLF